MEPRDWIGWTAIVFRGRPWYLAATARGICRLTLGDESFADFTRALSAWGALHRADEELDSCARQLAAYFHQQQRRFSLPLDLRGTPFQMRIWRELARIPYGNTLSYTEVAQNIGNPRAIRAAAAAIAANPVPIFIPCHRVIGKHGDLVGFAGGLALKAALLQLEGIPIQPQRHGESFRFQRLRRQPADLLNAEG